MGVLKEIEKAAKPKRIQKTFGDRYTEFRQSEVPKAIENGDWLSPSSYEPHELTGSSGLFGNNSPYYNKLLAREGILDRKMPASDFDNLLEWAWGTGDFSESDLPRLLDVYGMPAPNSMYRGDSGLDIVDRARTTRPLATSVDQDIAESFSKATAAMKARKEGAEPDPVFNRLSTIGVKDHAMRPRVLPVPMSGQSELILAPNVHAHLRDELLSDQTYDGFIKRMYQLRKKMGGAVEL